MLAGVAAGASVTRALCASEAEGVLQDRGRSECRQTVATMYSSTVACMQQLQLRWHLLMVNTATPSWHRPVVLLARAFVLVVDSAASHSSTLLTQQLQLADDGLVHLTMVGLRRGVQHPLAALTVVAAADACKPHVLAEKFSSAAPATAAPEPLAASCRAASMHRAKLLPWPSGWQLLALLLCLLQLQHAAAQIGPDSDWMDNSYSTEYRAASVVTNLWIAAFAVTSALFGLLGELGGLGVLR